MRVVFQQDRSLLKWAECRLQCRFPNSVTLGIADSELQAVFVFSNLRENQVEMSVYSKTPKAASRKILREVFSYPFLQLGVGRITAIVRESNLRSLSLTERLGFMEEGTMMKFYADGENAVLFGMLKEQCRWIYGRKRTESSSSS